MSHFDEDPNPHFSSRPLPSDFSAPPLIQPEPRQPWDGHLYHPDRIHQPDSARARVRPRQRQSSPVAARPRRRTEHDDHLYHPDHIQESDPIRAGLQQPQPYQQSPVPVPPNPRTPTEHDYYQPTSPPSRPHGPPSPILPEDMPLQTHTPSHVVPKPKHQPTRHPRPHQHGGTRPSHSRENLMYPEPNKTKPITWFGAVFCVILWLVIILGGILVLVIYLTYHPRTPHFTISSATLNAAYLDMGYLLNSDVTVLANFTNPNEKVKVDFSYVILKLYYGKYLIANQYIEPFSTYNSESKLHNVEFITSQVRLPLRVTEQLKTQVQRNRVIFEVVGIFHARSNFGSLLRYSYWLYGDCQIEMTGPPSGVMLTSHCRTKD